jgi:hypothetical protein
MPDTYLPADLEQLARRRAGAKMGWFIHAAIYVAVNAGLSVLSLASGRHWAIFPALGWGLGLAIHGAMVWFAGPGSALRESLVQAERQRLQAHGKPW